MFVHLSILRNVEQRIVLFTRYNSVFATPKACYGVSRQGVLGLGKENVSRLNESFDARKVLDEKFEWNVVSATTQLGYFSRCNRHKEVISLFIRMLELNVRPNEFTFGTVVPSSTILKDLNLGKQFHGFAMKAGLASNLFVGSVLLSLYAKLSSIEEAQRVFEDTCNPNVVSYTTLMCGYLEKRRFDDALRIFRAVPERNAVSWNAMISGYSQKGIMKRLLIFSLKC